MKSKHIRNEILKKSTDIKKYLTDYKIETKQLPKIKSIDTILIVDDDPTSNYINYKLFERLDISNNIKVVYNALEGLSFLKLNLLKPQKMFIFIDMDMPIIDGLEFLELANFCNFINKNTIKIIFISENDQETSKNHIKEHGFDIDFMKKPLNKEELYIIFDNF